MELNEKIFASLERIAVATRSALQGAVHDHKLSPLQANILLHVHDHDVTTVSMLADAMKLSRPTVSDAVKSLLGKDLIKKQPISDSRSYQIVLSAEGQKTVLLVQQYAQPFFTSIDSLDSKQKTDLWEALIHLIYTMERQGLISHQRMCFTCQHYAKDHLGYQHYCKLMDVLLQIDDLRIYCPEHKVV